MYFAKIYFKNANIIEPMGLKRIKSRIKRNATVFRIDSALFSFLTT